MKTLMIVAALILALALSSCAFLMENINRPHGFVPAEDAECQWGIIGHGASMPFKTKAGVFERADPLAYKVICRNDRGEYVAPGRCFEIDCVTPSDGL